MTLVRYVGPLAAYRGAIGLAAEGGAIIGGRLRLGDVAPASFVVTWNGEPYTTWQTWDGATAALSDYTATDMRDSPPDPAGLEVTAGEHVYRLEVV